MNIYPLLLKKKLLSLIREMAESPELFVKNPGKDFTRKRKLPFETVIRILISMGGNSIYKELLDGFGFNAKTPTASAFVQQREKVLPSALEHLMHRFNSNLRNAKTFRGYRLLAGDGSGLTFAGSPLCADTFIQAKPNIRGYNSMHMNVLYDLRNKIYLDACVQNIRQLNEKRALTDMVARSDICGKTILVADRGFESYNIFAHIGEKGWNYVIRVKDGAGGILSGLNLPVSDEFDFCVNTILTRKYTNEIKSLPEIYRFISSKTTFDFLEPGVVDFYPISFRVVRFSLDNGSFETVITNLHPDEFTPSDLKSIYNLRWGVESSFRALKYTIGLSGFHSKKRECIIQEVFARIIMYNFVETIISHIVVSHGNTRYDYQINFTVAVLVCRCFLRPWSNAPPDVDALIRKNIVPVRPNRHSPRNTRSNPAAISFTYRIS